MCNKLYLYRIDIHRSRNITKSYFKRFRTQDSLERELFCGKQRRHVSLNLRHCEPTDEGRDPGVVIQRKSLVKATVSSRQDTWSGSKRHQILRLGDRLAQFNLLNPRITLVGKRLDLSRIPDYCEVLRGSD